MASTSVLQPLITVTIPTPPRPPTTATTTATSTQTQHRLLYRGSLSLPDSHLLLDGLTFTGHAEKSMNLLENPLALALESMRGRPTLRFLGTMALKEGWVDYSGGVCLDIHPQATLSRIYFENMFCLSAISSADGKTDVGLRVALGDSNGPETTEIIIYGQLVSTSSNTDPTRYLQLNVARLTPTPPPTSLGPSSSRTNTLRLPRPDDPTPRKVPLAFTFGSKRMLSDSATSASTSAKRRKIDHSATKKDKDKGVDKDKPKKRATLCGNDVDNDMLLAREVMLYGAAVKSASGPGRGRSLSIGLEDDEALPADGAFKVPHLPVKSKAKMNAKGKGKAKERVVAEEADVFSSVDGETGGRRPTGKNNGKGRRKAVCDEEAADDGAGDGIGDVEKLNRLKIKKQTVKLLSSASPSTTTSPSDSVPMPLPASLPKTHPEFKELFGHVYRGVAFAFRTTIKTEALDTRAIDQMIEAHLRLYIPGYETVPTDVDVRGVADEGVASTDASSVVIVAGNEDDLS